MDTLLDKLESIKQKGCYSLTVFYGAGDGADDSDIPKLKREVKIVGSPVGYLGSMKFLFVGTVKEFLDFDFNKQPKIISNPPKDKEYEKSGLYCWGSDSSIESFKETNKFFPF